jgi:hypothetical protein
MKQTAVEWLIHQLITENEVTLKGENYKLFEIAKEIEREQIIDAYKEGCFDNILDEKTDKIRAEQYYNETFKSE